MSPLEELAKLLRPAGGGIYTVSTGVAEQRAVQRRIYGAADDVEIEARWKEALARLPSAKAFILGVPSDIGAGFRRGASFGPQALRGALLDRRSSLYRDPSIVDVGDVFCVPQLLDDEMLSPAQLTASRRAIYGDEDARPVSPLSIASRALTLIRTINPNARPIAIGGDHSIAWPVVASVADAHPEPLGILHFDAHTDLLETRLGVRYCFATWAYHANQRIGRSGRLVQVGLRISSKTRAHWESTLGVRQYWMEEMRRRPLPEIAAEIVDGLRRAGVCGVYISNDIDGTDPLEAASTGTPEPNGLYRAEVLHLIQSIGQAFPVWGADLVEVAPTLIGHDAAEPDRTLETAASYLELMGRYVAP
ncbi:MAG: arginase family protein [Myxococcota bacterium]